MHAGPIESQINFHESWRARVRELMFGGAEPTHEGTGGGQVYNEGNFRFSSNIPNYSSRFLKNEPGVDLRAPQLIDDSAAGFSDPAVWRRKIKEAALLKRKQRQNASSSFDDSQQGVLSADANKTSLQSIRPESRVSVGTQTPPKKRAVSSSGPSRSVSSSSVAAYTSRGTSPTRDCGALDVSVATGSEIAVGSGAATLNGEKHIRIESLHDPLAQKQAEPPVPSFLQREEPADRQDLTIKSLIAVKSEPGESPKSPPLLISTLSKPPDAGMQNERKGGFSLEDLAGGIMSRTQSVGHGDAFFVKRASNAPVRPPPPQNGRFDPETSTCNTASTLPSVDASPIRTVEASRRDAATGRSFIHSKTDLSFGVHNQTSSRSCGVTGEETAPPLSCVVRGGRNLSTTSINTKPTNMSRGSWSNSYERIAAGHSADVPLQSFVEPTYPFPFDERERRDEPPGRSPGSYALLHRSHGKKGATPIVSSEPGRGYEGSSRTYHTPRNGMGSYLSSYVDLHNKSSLEYESEHRMKSKRKLASSMHLPSTPSSDRRRGKQERSVNPFLSVPEPPMGLNQSSSRKMKRLSTAKASRHQSNDPAGDSTDALFLSPSRTVTLDNINLILPYFYRVPGETRTTSQSDFKGTQRQSSSSDSEGSVRQSLRGHRGHRSLHWIDKQATAPIHLKETSEKRSDTAAVTSLDAKLHRDLSPVERVRRENDRWWREYYSQYGGKCSAARSSFDDCAPAQAHAKKHTHQVTPAADTFREPSDERPAVSPRASGSWRRAGGEDERGGHMDEQFSKLELQRRRAMLLLGSRSDLDASGDSQRSPSPAALRPLVARARPEEEQQRRKSTESRSPARLRRSVSVDALDVEVSDDSEDDQLGRTW